MKRRTLVIAAGIVLVAVIGVSAWLALRPSGAQALARDYVDALAAGDADAAVTMLACEGADAEVLRGAAAGLTQTLSNPRVDAIAEGESRARATVSYDLAGTPTTGTLELTADGSGWHVGCGGLGAITSTTSLGDAVAIGTQILPAGEAVMLLPGVYAVASAPVGILEGSTSAVLALGGTAEVEVASVVSDTAVDAVTTQLQAYLDACTRPADAVPEHCGIRVPWAADLARLDALTFRIETSPTLALSDDLTSFSATGGVLVATATGTTRAGDTGTFSYRAEEWSLRGAVEVTGNQLVISVD